MRELSLKEIRTVAGDLICGGGNTYAHFILTDNATWEENGLTFTASGTITGLFGIWKAPQDACGTSIYFVAKGYGYVVSKNGNNGFKYDMIFSDYFL